MRTHSFSKLLLPALLAAALSAAQAQSTTPGDPVVTSSTTSTGSNAENRLVDQYAASAGSTGNARSLVQGLRSGGTVTMDSTAGGGGSSFAVPTKPMGYGNVRIAMALASTQMRNEGITKPTAADWQAALVGDGTQSGVLQKRADGMGWGQIAHSMGTQLGTVMSGKAPASNASVSHLGAGKSAGGTVGTTTGNGGGNAYGQTRSGIVTAGGARVGAGVATGGGGQSAGGSQGGGGHAYGQTQSAGIVSAAGSHAGGNAGGNGGGNNAGGRGKP